MTHKMKDNQQVAPVVADDGRTVTFYIADGGEPLVLDMTKLHPDVLARAAAVGMAQVRIIDAAAVGVVDAEGRAIPKAERMAMKRERMALLVEHYMTGTSEWSRRAAGGAGNEGGLVLRAVAAVQGVTVEAMGVRLDELAERKGVTRKALLAKLVKAEAVRAKMDELRGPVDSRPADELLDELEAKAFGG